MLTLIRVIPRLPFRASVPSPAVVLCLQQYECVSALGASLRHAWKSRWSLGLTCDDVDLHRRKTPQVPAFAKVLHGRFIFIKLTQLVPSGLLLGKKKSMHTR